MGVARNLRVCLIVTLILYLTAHLIILGVSLGTLKRNFSSANIFTSRAPSSLCVGMYLLYLLGDVIGGVGAFTSNRGALVGFVLIEVIAITMGIYFTDYYTTPFAILVVIFAVILIIALGQKQKEQRTAAFRLHKVPPPFVQEEKETLQTESINEN